MKIIRVLYNLTGSLRFVVTLPEQAIFEHYQRIFDLFILKLVYFIPKLKNVWIKFSSLVLDYSV